MFIDNKNNFSWRRSVSPTQTTMTTREKYVSNAPTGIGSGIPGLEALDAELRNVRPHTFFITIIKSTHFLVVQ